MKKLKEEIRKDIKDSFKILCGSGVPEEDLTKMHANHCIGLIEYVANTQNLDWFKEER